MDRDAVNEKVRERICGWKRTLCTFIIIDVGAFPWGIYILITYCFVLGFLEHTLSVLTTTFFRNNLEFGDTYDLINFGFVVMCGIFATLFAAFSDCFISRYKSMALSLCLLMFALIFLTCSLMKKTAMILAFSSKSLHTIYKSIIMAVFLPLVGDQYTFPIDNVVFYYTLLVMLWTFNLGTLLAAIIFLVFKETFICLDNMNCYILPFGICLAGTLSYLCLFVFGKNYITKRRAPGQNLWQLMWHCYRNAKQRQKDVRSNSSVDQPPEQHTLLLDYSVEEFGYDIVGDTRTFWKIFALYVMLLVYQTMYVQISSTWVHQATMMEGDLLYHEIFREHIALISSAFVLLLIPIMKKCIHPVEEQTLKSYHLKRISIAMIFMVFAFLAAGVLSILIEANLPSSPTKNNGQIRVMNGLNCPVDLSSPQIISETYTIHELHVFSKINIPIEGSNEYAYTISQPKCNIDQKGVFFVRKGIAMSYFLQDSSLEPYEDQVITNKDSMPLLRVLSITTNPKTLVFKDSKSGAVIMEIKTDNRTLNKFRPASEITGVMDDKIIMRKRFRTGGVYVLLIYDKGNKLMTKVNTISRSHTLHLLTQIPQIFLMTISEIIFYINLQHFTYTQSPRHLKAVCWSFFILTTTLGQIIVFGWTTFGQFTQQSSEFFLFAAIQGGSLFLFHHFQKTYEYMEPKQSEIEHLDMSWVLMNKSDAEDIQNDDEVM